MVMLGDWRTHTKEAPKDLSKQHVRIDPNDLKIKEASKKALFVYQP